MVQSLEPYQLDDLPTVVTTGLTSCHGLEVLGQKDQAQQFLNILKRDSATNLTERLSWQECSPSPRPTMCSVISATLLSWSLVPGT